MSEPFIDERGVIEDLIGAVDSVTYIRTVEGAIRGNHFHKLTTQWTFVVGGRLRMADSHGETFVGPKEMVVHEPGEPHAWKAVMDTDCLVFTRGPRSGDGYETDTHRLERPLIV